MPLAKTRLRRGLEGKRAMEQGRQPQPENQITETGSEEPTHPYAGRFMALDEDLQEMVLNEMARRGLVDTPERRDRIAASVPYGM